MLSATGTHLDLCQLSTQSLILRLPAPVSPPVGRGGPAARGARPPPPAGPPRKPGSPGVVPEEQKQAG